MTNGFSLTLSISIISILINFADLVDTAPPKLYLMCGVSLLMIIAVFVTTSVKAELPADFDNNGSIDVNDLLILTDNWLLPPSRECLADTNGDSYTDFEDFAVLSESFGISSVITATASSRVIHDYPASNAIDGNFATKWVSPSEGDAQLLLDLGYQRPLDSLEIHWADAYAIEYEILTSSDSQMWTTVYTTTNGIGGIEYINIAPRSAHYIMVNCIKPAYYIGSSIYEIVIKPLDDSERNNWFLAWEDNFDTFKPGCWEIANFTWDQNLAICVPENLTFDNGVMNLNLTSDPEDNRSYYGAGYRSKSSFRYGKFVVRLKAAPGSGIISSFVTFRDPPDDPIWNEIDVKFLGKDTELIEFNPWWGRGDYCDPSLFNLPFDAADDFHEYAFEWHKDYIRWMVGDTTYHVDRENVPWLSQQLFLNIWISADADWAGIFDRSQLPTQAQFDYIRYYQNIR